MTMTTTIQSLIRRTSSWNSAREEAAQEYIEQSQRLAQYRPDQEDDTTGSTQAIQAKFITAQDPIIEVANGGRLPAVPLEEAVKLNTLKDKLQGRETNLYKEIRIARREAKDGTVHGLDPSCIPGLKRQDTQGTKPDAPLRDSMPQSQTNPLFPPVPLYGPPTLLRDLQCMFLRATSAVGSFCFLLVITLGALATDIAPFFEDIWMRMTFRDPGQRRPFYEEEKKRGAKREKEEQEWMERHKVKEFISEKQTHGFQDGEEQFIPTEGGPDKLVCDVDYYARRVGLAAETFLVQTEDGFIIELWHIYNPLTTKPSSSSERKPHSPEVFPDDRNRSPSAHSKALAESKPKYPVLMIHGLLQSAGAYCCSDDTSLAFYLCKSGYDVWLGNNRCGFKPRHNLLHYADPRMWAWNIRQMGVLDLPALISRVLTETDFEKLALIAHSQGTTQTFVALAKEQRPDIGKHISVFCALAPAAYAGPLIGKAYFKFMHVVPPALFRCIFGIHAFIPLMMAAQGILNPRFYGYMGYRIFNFLFNWSDERWERALRDRFFIFAPVYVSAESMRWWLGRECFAKQRCILATKTEKEIEEQEDEEEDEMEEMKRYYKKNDRHSTKENTQEIREKLGRRTSSPNDEDKGKFAWYDEQVPPFALWVCGNDALVDGRRLLRRFERGREPYVDVVHSKIIEGYEHLDVIWAMDSIEKVGKEVKEVIWKTADKDVREMCRVPKGCENVEPWQSTRQSRNSDEKELIDGQIDGLPNGDSGLGKTKIDTTAGEWSRKDHKENEKMVYDLDV